MFLFAFVFYTSHPPPSFFCLFLCVLSSAAAPYMHTEQHNHNHTSAIHRMPHLAALRPIGNPSAFRTMLEDAA
ncbi:hypothetical protein BC629DRAFT_1522959 [Irpex lacteus]|nr:hypothetical protein BC629DRAFT_1522959 [Irpex lacteus]